MNVIVVCKVQIERETFRFDLLDLLDFFAHHTLVCTETLLTRNTTQKKIGLHGNIIDTSLYRTRSAFMNF